MNREGEAYVAGYTHSTTFPATKGAYQTTCPGYDVYCGFVTELNSTGEGLVWSTLLGNAGTTSEGTGQVYLVSSVSLDALGNVYVAGQTSSGFPEVDPVQPNLDTDSAGFVTKFNSTGSGLLFSTMLGDPGTSTLAEGSAVDALGNIYVAGTVGHASGIPITPGALQPKYGGGSPTAGLQRYTSKAPIWCPVEVSTTSAIMWRATRQRFFRFQLRRP